MLEADCLVCAPGPCTRSTAENSRQRPPLPPKDRGSLTAHDIAKLELGAQALHEAARVICDRLRQELVDTSIDGDNFQLVSVERDYAETSDGALVVLAIEDPGSFIEVSLLDGHGPASVLEATL